MKKLILSQILSMFLASISLCSCNGTDQPVTSSDWGIQLYTLRTMIGTLELYDANHTRVLDSLHAYGFTKAELYGYENGTIFGVPAERFMADLESSGLHAVSSHVQNALTPEEVESGDFSAKREWWQECIDKHKQIGLDTLVYVWYALPQTKHELMRIAQYMDWIGALCREQGVAFGYHNHDHELRVVEDTIMLDYLIENTTPKNVFIEMDVYWTVIGNASPVAYFNKYPGRFGILHIKDQYEIGQSGMVGFDAIFRNVEKSGAKHFIVEQETTERTDMLESLRISMDYLFEK